MKIVQVTFSLWNGGAEKFVVELSNELSKADHVSIFLLTFVDNEPGMLQCNNISRNVQNISLGIKNKKSLINIAKVYRFLKSEKPDIVHIHSSLALIYFIPFILLFSKIRYIHTIHSSLTKSYKKLFTFLNRAVLVRNRLLNVCISKHIYELFSQRYRKVKFVNISNGLAQLLITEKYNETKQFIDSLKIDKDTKVLIAIGNYSNFKRFDLLIEVMRSLIEENIILLLLGEDKTKDQLNYKHIVKNKPKNVHILGLKSNVADYIECSDALVISSSFEGMPLVSLESLSLGKFIITTPAGGVVDVVEDKKNGFISSDFSHESIILSIKAYLHLNKDQLDAIAKLNMEKFTREFSISVCAENHLKFYKN